jgi:ubiquinol-cytochrome c reductase iron-sulfur subunit
VSGAGERPEQPGATGGLGIGEDEELAPGQIDDNEWEEGHGSVDDLPMARATDPHLGDAARYPRRTEGIIALFLLVGFLGVCAFGAAFVVDATTQTLAASLGVGLFCIGFGMTAWGKYLMPRGPFVEARHALRSSRAQREVMAAALVERTGVVVKRRKMLGGLLAAGMGVFSIVALFPLVRSLGPRPGNSLFTTNWRRGRYLVDSTGNRIHVTQMQVGGLLTVFPQAKGELDTDDAVATDQTVLIRVQSDDLVTVKGRTDWAPAGYVAYSKVCTHLGCPVGLYEQELELLVCPCHQSMFDVRNGAVPKFGPAPRPLPQLPLSVDTTGFLVARAGFNQPIGPGFWERTTEGNGPGSATPAPGTSRYGAT